MTTRTGDNSSLSAATITDAGVDLPALLAAGSTSDSPTEGAPVKNLLSAIALSSQSSNAKLPETREAALALRKDFTGTTKDGSRKGCTATVIICNKTATMLKYDKASNRRGDVYGPETKNPHVKNFPMEIGAGTNAYFLQVNPTKSAMGQPTYEGVEGLFALRIVVYDVSKKAWVDSSQAVAFSWKTSPGSPPKKSSDGSLLTVPRVPNTARFESATSQTQRWIRRSGCIYDGTKICCDLTIEGVDDIHPTFTFTFTQMERGNIVNNQTVPFGMRVKKWFGGGRASTDEAREANAKAKEEKREDDKKFGGVDGMTV